MSEETIKTSEHTIEGETFKVSKEGEKIFLEHPVWSLVSFGDTLIEAQNNLLKQSSEVCKIYSGFKDQEMTEKAIAMKEYLLKIKKSGFFHFIECG